MGELLAAVHERSECEPDAKRKRDSAQPQDAKRKRDSAQPQERAKPVTYDRRRFSKMRNCRRS